MIKHPCECDQQSNGMFNVPFHAPGACPNQAVHQYVRPYKSGDKTMWLCYDCHFNRDREVQ